MILAAMSPMPLLGVCSLLVQFSFCGTVEGFPCSEVCECYRVRHHGVVADCSRRNLRFLPKRLPEETQYLDLSGNTISTLLPQEIADLPSDLLVLNLSGNPLSCDDSTLSNLRSSITIKFNCQGSSFLVGYNLKSLYTKEKRLHHRTRRAATECVKGSPNCVKHTCGSNEYWLSYATYWGCCKGTIHDLRETYCSEFQGVQPCNHPQFPHFKCNNGHCVPENWLCNRINDCQDGSDEVGCVQCNGTDNFRCWNGRCVPQTFVCDAYNDCGDGSDETFCRTLNGGWCKTTEYRCPTDVCIPGSKVCDGKADCADYSDETGCNATCKSGWKNYLSSCYKYFNSHRRWTDARDLCRRLGADLATIISRDVQDFVFGLGSHQPFNIWIGLRQRIGSRDFVWTDGSPVGNFSFWSAGEPSPGQAVCAEIVRSAISGRWRTGECTKLHSAYVCEKVRDCDTSQAGNYCNGNFEKPKMTSFPSKEIMSANYGSEVSVECKASGFPRPTVMLFINALRAYTMTSGHSFMAPYEANMTLVVKMTSEVECHMSNRLGSSFVRMRIEMKDKESAFLKAVLRLTAVPFAAELKDPLSEEFKTLAGLLEQQMMSVYRDVADVRDVSVAGFREGSIVADIILRTLKGTSSDVQGLLGVAVKNKKFGDAVILDSIGEVKACPKEFFNVTWGATVEGEYATKVCPRGASGMSRRKCLENGVWGYPDYSRCTSKEFNQLKDKIDELFNASTPSDNQVTLVLIELSSLTEPKKYDSLMAGDIKGSTQILRKVVNYNTKFSNSRETTPENIEGFLQAVSNLLDVNNLRDFSELQKTDKTATDLTKVTEDYGLQAAAGLENVNLVVKDNIAMESKLVPSDAQGPVTFPGYSDGPLSSPLWTNSGKQFITLPKALFTRKSNSSSNGTKVASFLFRTLAAFLTQGSAYEKVGQRFKVQSRIIASSVQPPAGKLVEPVVIVFGGVKNEGRSVVCVYWDYYLNSKGGGWSTDGCWLATHDNGTVTCVCNHLTNFAVLMDASGISNRHSEHSKTLSYITVVGCSLSLLGIIITLTLHFVLWRFLKSPKTVIHVNLCFALLTANALLLIGSASTKYKILCTVISILLHYFFLSAIFWMLAEGLQIYSAIVKVFGGEGKLKYFYILGWGVPLIIVVTCLGVTETAGYGGDKTCWLSVTSGLIWTFIGPALTVVLINSIIFALVLRAMMTSHKMMGASDKQKIKLGIKCSVVVLPLLGVTWVFGVLAFDQDTVVFLYLFAIFNSLQGFFVFIFHCVFDQQVRNAINTWRSKRQRTNYASGVETAPKCCWQYYALFSEDQSFCNRQLLFDIASQSAIALPTERLPSTGVRLSDMTQRNSGPFSSREALTAWDDKRKVNRV